MFFYKKKLGTSSEKEKPSFPGVCTCFSHNDIGVQYVSVALITEPLRGIRIPSYELPLSVDMQDKGCPPITMVTPISCG